MRILILNWRCPFHPKSGGAEALTYRLAHHLAVNGHEVVWFSAWFPGAALEETVDGITLVRRGSQASVHLHAANWFRGQRGRFDVIVDEVNTVPFFAHLYADAPTVALFPQLAREVWWYEAAFPVNAIGYL